MSGQARVIRSFSCELPRLTPKCRSRSFLLHQFWLLSHHIAVFPRSPPALSLMLVAVVVCIYFCQMLLAVPVTVLLQLQHVVIYKTTAAKCLLALNVLFFIRVYRIYQSLVCLPSLSFVSISHHKYERKFCIKKYYTKNFILYLVLTPTYFVEEGECAPKFCSKNSKTMFMYGSSQDVSTFWYV